MANPSKFTKKERRELFRAMGLVTQIGFTMAACIGIGVLLGMFLDGRLGTSPWLLLIFSLLGCLSAFKFLFDLAKKF